MEGGCQKEEKVWIVGPGRGSTLLARCGLWRGRGWGYGFVDAGAGADDVRAPEFARGGGEHALQLIPFADVGRLEDGACGGGGAGGVGGEEGGGFGAEGEVGEEDVALVGEEGAGEMVVDAWRVGR